MKAIVRHTYGSPDVLGMEDVDTPTPKDDEVLIKVHAVSLIPPVAAKLSSLFVSAGKEAKWRSSISSS